MDRNTHDISSIKRVETRKFLELGSCSRAKQRQINVQKVCCMCKIVFLLIRRIDYFLCRSCCCRRLALNFFFLFLGVNYEYINESFAFSPG